MTGHLAYVRANVPAIDDGRVRSLDVLVIPGPVADDAGAYALQELATERRLPVFVERPSRWHADRLFIPN